MPINNLTYNPLLSVTISATEALPANRFVGFDGTLNSAGEQMFGVTEIAWNSGDKASLIVQGIAILETAAAFFAGDEVCTAADGKATPQAGTDPVAGIALEDCSSGDYLRVLLK